ncbi:hypothetical protein CHARACLAT_022339 [Characodon lateralis]|uniref:Uncharacterized protein n=1 Tax=Characodon lateralis TaxID=208331 RepID=A0ABU7EMK0_9TELE|nr:hypothetical protein [Characodon lateralis]
MVNHERSDQTEAEPTSAQNREQILDDHQTSSHLEKPSSCQIWPKVLGNLTPCCHMTPHTDKAPSSCQIPAVRCHLRTVTPEEQCSCCFCRPGLVLNIRTPRGEAVSWKTWKNIHTK